MAFDWSPSQSASQRSQPTSSQTRTSTASPLHRTLMWSRFDGLKHATSSGLTKLRATVSQIAQEAAAMDTSEYEEQEQQEQQQQYEQEQHQQRIEPAVSAVHDPSYLPPLSSPVPLPLASPAASHFPPTSPGVLSFSPFEPPGVSIPATFVPDYSVPSSSLAPPVSRHDLDSSTGSLDFPSRLGDEFAEIPIDDRRAEDETLMLTTTGLNHTQPQPLAPLLAAPLTTGGVLSSHSAFASVESALMRSMALGKAQEELALSDQEGEIAQLRRELRESELRERAESQLRVESEQRMNEEAARWRTENNTLRNQLAEASHARDQAIRDLDIRVRDDGDQQRLIKELNKQIEDEAQKYSLDLQLAQQRVDQLQEMLEHERTRVSSPSVVPAPQPLPAVVHDLLAFYSATGERLIGCAMTDADSEKAAKRIMEEWAKLNSLVRNDPIDLPVAAIERLMIHSQESVAALSRSTQARRAALQESMANMSSISASLSIDSPMEESERLRLELAKAAEFRTSMMAWKEAAQSKFEKLHSEYKKEKARAREYQEQMEATMAELKSQHAESIERLTAAHEVELGQAADVLQEAEQRITAEETAWEEERKAFEAERIAWEEMKDEWDHERNAGHEDRAAMENTIDSMKKELAATDAMKAEFTRLQASIAEAKLAHDHSLHRLASERAVVADELAALEARAHSEAAGHQQTQQRMAAAIERLEADNASRAEEAARLKQEKALLEASLVNGTAAASDGLREAMEEERRAWQAEKERIINDRAANDERASIAISRLESAKASLAADVESLQEERSRLLKEHAAQLEAALASAEAARQQERDSVVALEHQLQQAHEAYKTLDHEHAHTQAQMQQQHEQTRHEAAAPAVLSSDERAHLVAQFNDKYQEQLSRYSDLQKECRALMKKDEEQQAIVETLKQQIIANNNASHQHTQNHQQQPHQDGLNSQSNPSSASVAPSSSLSSAASSVFSSLLTLADRPSDANDRDGDGDDRQFERELHRERIVELEGLLSDSQAEARLLRQSLSAAMAGNDPNEELQRDNERLRARARQLELDNSGLQSLGVDYQRLQREFDDKENSLEKCRVDLQRVQLLFEGAVQEGEEEAARLKAANRALQDELAQQRQRVDAAASRDAEFHQLEQQLQAVRSQSQSLQRQLVEAEQEKAKIAQQFQSLSQQLKDFASSDSDALVDRRLVISILLRFFESPDKGKDKEEVIEIMFKLMKFTEEEKKRVYKARQGGIGGRLYKIASFLSPFDPDEAAALALPQPGQGGQANLSDLWLEFLLKSAQPTQPGQAKAPATPQPQSQLSSQSKASVAITAPQPQRAVAQTRPPMPAYSYVPAYSGPPPMAQANAATDKKTMAAVTQPAPSVPLPVSVPAPASAPSAAPLFAPSLPAPAMSFPAPPGFVPPPPHNGVPYHFPPPPTGLPYPYPIGVSGRPPVPLYSAPSGRAASPALPL